MFKDFFSSFNLLVFWGLIVAAIATLSYILGANYYYTLLTEFNIDTSILRVEGYELLIYGGVALFDLIPSWLICVLAIVCIAPFFVLMDREIFKKFIGSLKGDILINIFILSAITGFIIYCFFAYASLFNETSKQARQEAKALVERNNTVKYLSTFKLTDSRELKGEVIVCNTNYCAILVNKEALLFKRTAIDSIKTPKKI